ncbi:MAG: sulfotransferase family protein [Chloroflexota bacterium]
MVSFQGTMIRKPILIIGCPRSGTTLLYNVLSEVSTLWSIGMESKAIIERHHHPSEKGWASGALTDEDLTPASRDAILSAFRAAAAPGDFWRRVNRTRVWLRDNPAWRTIKRRGRTQQPGAAFGAAVPQLGVHLLSTLVRLGNRLRLDSNRPIRLLEKTPENCLRLPFLLALFPDAQIIYLIRNGPANVNSLMEGWRQPHLFPGYQVPEPVRIPGDERGRWAFTLIPGWRELLDRPLEEVCAWQWIRCNEAVLDHREQTAGSVPYHTVHYEDLIAAPGDVLRGIADFIGVDYQKELSHSAGELPRINVISAPDREKWRRQNPEAIRRILPLIRPTMARLGYPDLQAADGG